MNISPNHISDRPDFEPFGEQLDARAAAPHKGSRHVAHGGIAVFWSLVVVIIAARAAFFDSTVFAPLARIASLF